MNKHFEFCSQRYDQGRKNYEGRGHPHSASGIVERRRVFNGKITSRQFEQNFLENCPPKRSFRAFSKHFRFEK